MTFISVSFKIRELEMKIMLPHRVFEGLNYTIYIKYLVQGPMYSRGTLDRISTIVIAIFSKVYFL